MKKKKLILVIIILLISVALAAMALAAPPSTLPHAFYGTTTINGANMPVNAVITATCDSYSSTITVTTAGEYGGASGDDEKLIVQNCSDGDTITFSVSVSGYTGTSTITDTYESGAVEEKTLAFTGNEEGAGGGGGGGGGGGAAATTTPEGTTTSQPGATTTIPGRQTTSTTKPPSEIIPPKITKWFATPLGKILLVVITVVIVIVLIFKFIL